MQAGLPLTVVAIDGLPFVRESSVCFCGTLEKLLIHLGMVYGPILVIASWGRAVATPGATDGVPSGWAGPGFRAPVCLLLGPGAEPGNAQCNEGMTFGLVDAGKGLDDLGKWQ